MQNQLHNLGLQTKLGSLSACLALHSLDCLLLMMCALPVALRVFLAVIVLPLS